MSFLVASLLLLAQPAHTDSQASALKLGATPKGWVQKPPASRMRLAEFTLPKAEGDAEDAALGVFYFGGGGGNVQANLDRWIGQMSQPDGRSSKELAKSSKLDANGLAVTIVDVPGTYVAETSPGSAERFNKPGFRLRAAVVEGKGGPYFVKLTGPSRTIAKWEASFTEFLKGLRVE
jgi:hypothetical protein